MIEDAFGAHLEGGPYGFDVDRTDHRVIFKGVHRSGLNTTQHTADGDDGSAREFMVPGVVDEAKKGAVLVVGFVQVTLIKLRFSTRLGGEDIAPAFAGFNRSLGLRLLVAHDALRGWMSETPHAKAETPRMRP